MIDLNCMEDELNRYVGSEAGRGYVRNHLLRYMEMIKLIPVHEPLAVLDIGAFIPLAAYLRRVTPHSYTWHSHGESGKKTEITIQGEAFTVQSFDVELDRFPFDDSSFDLVLCSEVVEHLGLDPFFMLAEINRVLKPEGVLLLSTPNVVSARNAWKMLLGFSPYLYASFTLTRDRHNREYSAFEVASMLLHSGFKAERLFTSNVYFPRIRFPSRGFLRQCAIDLLFKLNRTSQWRGDCIFALARKTGPVVERYPREFYDLPSAHSMKFRGCVHGRA